MGGLFSIPDDKRADMSSTSNAKALPQVNTDENSLGVVHLLVGGKGESSKGGHWSLLFDFGNWSSYENVEDGNGSPLKSFVGVQVHLGLAQIEQTNTQFTTCLTTVRDKRSPLNLSTSVSDEVEFRLCDVILLPTPNEGAKPPWMSILTFVFYFVLFQRKTRTRECTALGQYAILGVL